MEATALSWSKLKDGSWGVRSSTALTEGGAVTVCRKDGSRSTATVGRKVWSGNGVWLYATAPTAPKGAAPVVRDWSVAEQEDDDDDGYAAERAAERAMLCSDYY